MSTPKREPNAYDICPKHKGFYKSCGCKWDKEKKDPNESEVVEDKGEDQV